MSKRIIYPQQSGGRKKQKLDTYKSDHNFPLSQPLSSNKAAEEDDNWGDDIDDEILLQASQAYEQACNSSVLPECSQLGQPLVTSTQLHKDTVPTTSRSTGIFTFKIPAAGPKSTLTHVKNNYSGIPPRKDLNTSLAIESVDLTSKDIGVNEQDPKYIYQQLLKLKEENENLKKENDKLQEKCVTKEGEASILRTQLKTVQVEVDNARLEKVKMKEQAQVQWSGKLSLVNNQMHELQTQLDFKNLEILNMKEKCKMLESNKIKLTQVTLAGNDLTTLRLNNSAALPNNFLTQAKKLKTVSCTVQTDYIPPLVKLTKPCRSEKNSLMDILPYVIDSDTDHQFSMLDYNEELKGPTDVSPNRYIIFSTFHRMLSSGNDCNNKTKNKISLSSIYEDLTYIVASNNDVEKAMNSYVNIFNATRTVLEDVQCGLETISRRLTCAFEKDMGKKYIRTTNTFVVMSEQDLFIGQALYKKEQGMLPRRMVAILFKILENSKAVHIFSKLQNIGSGRSDDFMDLLNRICSQLDTNCCAFLYSGLLLSIVLVLEVLTAHSHLDSNAVLAILKSIISSRPMLAVSCRVLRVLTSQYKTVDHQITLCSEGRVDVKEDYERGVLFYRQDTCLLQVLLKQVEASLRCMGKQRLERHAVATTRDLLAFYPRFAATRAHGANLRCDCETELIQLIVYALRTCSSLLDTSRTDTIDAAEAPEQMMLLGACRSGLQLVHSWWLNDADILKRLQLYAAHLMVYCEELQAVQHDAYHAILLRDLAALFQPMQEEETPSLQEQPWLRCFESFSIGD